MYTSASSAHGRSWGKRRVRRGIRDWSAGAAGRRSANLACESWRGSLERRDAARLRPVQGRTTERVHSPELAIILLFFFSRSATKLKSTRSCRALDEWSRSFYALERAALHRENGYFRGKELHECNCSRQTAACVWERAR